MSKYFHKDITMEICRSTFTNRPSWSTINTFPLLLTFFPLCPNFPDFLFAQHKTFLTPRTAPALSPACFLPFLPSFFSAQTLPTTTSFNKDLLEHPDQPRLRPLLSFLYSFRLCQNLTDHNFLTAQTLPTTASFNKELPGHYPTSPGSALYFPSCAPFLFATT